MYKFNDNEKSFIKILEDAKSCVKGELELDNFEGKWFAMDYREDMEGAFSIDIIPYDKPLITEEEAEEMGINVMQCCDYCNAWIVG